MALIFHSGFEPGTFIEIAAVTGSPTVESAIKNTGGYSMRCNSTGTAAFVQGTGSNAGTRASVYIYIAIAPGAICSILGDANTWGLRLTSSRTIDLWESATERVTGTTVLAVETWYRISFTLDDSNQHGYYWIDDVAEGDYDGTVTTFTDLFGVVSAGITADLYFDDLAVDSESSSTADIGAILSAIVANPNAAGDTNAFDTAVPDVAHYLNYDDPAGALDDATYVEESAKAALADIANLDSCTDIGLGATDVIDAVNCFARMWGDDADPTAGMQVKDETTADNTIVLFADDATLEWIDKYYPTMPHDSAVWTQTRFNALQVGGYHGADADNTRLSCVYVMVAYHAVSAPAERRIFITHV